MANKIIFYAPKNANLMIGADEIQEEVRTVDGRILKQSANVRFIEHFLITEDAPTIKAVRKCLTYKQGKIVEVKTEEEYHTLLGQIAKKRLVGEGRPVEVKLPIQEMAGYVPTENTPNDLVGMQ